jgi:hypothetical protein
VVSLNEPSILEILAFNKIGGEKVKKVLLMAAMALILVLSLGAPVIAGNSSTGNGAPSGNHFTLNIIGVAKNKSANMDQGAGNVIFVPLDGRTSIYLFEGDFAVLDKNGTDGRAEFQLPKPGVDAYIIGQTDGKDTVTDYSVFVRPLGKPGGWSTITTCADLLDSTFGGLLSSTWERTIKNNVDPVEGGICSLEQVGSEITLREKGKSTFTNVTAQLLTLVFEVELDYEGDGIVDDTVYVRVPIFDAALENEYWAYDNDGLKLLQARFYPGVPSDLTDWDSPYLD